MADAGLTADQALLAWLEHLAHERRLSPRTLEAYGHIGRYYVAFLERHRGGPQSLSDLGTVTAAEVRAHLAERRSGDRPLNARSLSQTLAAIRGFHVFLDRRCGVAAPQLALVRGPRVKPSLPRPVTEDQARGLLHEPEADPDAEPWEAARDRAVLTLLYGCGLRISEALSLKRADAPCPTPCASPARATRCGWPRSCPRCARRWTPIWRCNPSSSRRISPCSAPSAAARLARVRFRPRSSACGPPRPARLGHAPCAPPQLRHPFARGRGGPALHSGTTGPRQPVHHPEIHPGRRRPPAGRLRGRPPATLGPRS